MVRDGYKMTGLGEIPEDWDVNLFSDIAEIKGRVGWKGYTIHDLRESGPLVLGAENISKNNKLNLLKTTHLTIEKYEESPEIMVNQWDILIVQRGSLGKVTIVDRKLGKTTINPSLILVKNIKIASLFLYYWLCGEKTQNMIQDNLSQTGVPMISQSQVKNFIIPLPPASVQKKIASILSSVDENIEKTGVLIEKYKHVKKGLMSDLLTKGIDEERNLRSEDTHEFKDSVLGRVPVEWDVKPCESICREIVVGIVIRPAQYYRPDGVPVLRSANVHENKINADDLVYMSQADNSKLKKSQLRTGDLVTVRTGYPGTTSVVPTDFDGCNCIDIVISRPDQTKIRSDYLSIWINSDYGKRQVLEGQGGLAQQHFNVGEMRNLLVHVPGINEQQRIAEILTAADQRIEKEESYRNKLLQIKKGLMQDILTGKVRVTV
ncbi:restriction endonuclease subunit S [Methanococcoides sp. NM1]|uniref:restriction endonuclease subunit S n=1 Tax=Methanococcoides sp. NM1 TaxID=1201013 RepID=UPI0010823213|nr:restriction endonuclease subunit S [Methanococcoides sp. NM1]